MQAAKELGVNCNCPLRMAQCGLQQLVQQLANHFADIEKFPAQSDLANLTGLAASDILPKRYELRYL